jgi:hypothetical protein
MNLPMKKNLFKSGSQSSKNRNAMAGKSAKNRVFSQKRKKPNILKKKIFSKKMHSPVNPC